ncbi:uncharacterized protein F5Z01DRAFT_722093 [Emericellopsis atlantica]|uniref:Rhomboid-type serine protease n=1 Tax=Emericellopsis atlantica TaxID=2614577 RepID=A0A9P7ZPB4_9HYPO|nr:uncharacterized protein F5Z01DRAFT_722093 [Emericellopsis atlantica]KAG9255347.1 hypothetical protein F5Z01DRAFT_722093 [Emericellopsis atlantica]
MASNQDYYYSSGAQQQQPGSHLPPIRSPSPVSLLDPRYANSQAGTPAPSYHTNPYAAPPSTLGYNKTPSPAPYPPDQPSRTGPSPFDTVFDDNVYPVNSRHDPAAASNSDMSQPGYYQQDTGYYGQGRGGPNHPEDIPLQDHPGGKSGDPEMLNDHVYDTPDGSGRRKKRKQKIALGQLGMIASDKKRIPWCVYVFTVAQIAVFIGEIVQNGILTGSPIMIKPQFNYMIGPSTQVMINMGARYAPCMHNVPQIQGSDIEVKFLCPNATSWDETCPLSTLCGFGGDVPDPVFDGNADQTPQPNQWYRFIIPMFLHAGIIHIGFNMLLQLTLGREMEQVIGSIRFFLVYVSSGIFGFVMGGNFAPPAIASTGASGSIFGILALNLLDLLYSWSDRKSPVKDLLFIIADMIISFVLGLLPGLDNFSHIGGFLMGLALGISVLHSPNALRLRIGQDTTYARVTESEAGIQPFLKNPTAFFKGRKPLWWAWWLVRVGALILVVVVFIFLITNFYTSAHSCDWCKYLSCIPVNNWCELGTIE